MKASQAELTRLQDARREAEKKLVEEIEQAQAVQAELKRIQDARNEAKKKLADEAQQVEAAQAELKRLQDARRKAEQKLFDETQQAEATAKQLMQAEAARQEAEKKLADETQQAEMVESDFKRMEEARLEAEQKRAEASKQAEEFEKMQAEMARLEVEQKEIEKFLKTDEPVASQAPLGQHGSTASAMPEVCSERIEVAHRQFADQGFSKELWLRHVFECQECCAPILTDVMDQHVTHVVAQPHTVVLFDFDQYAIKAKYEEQLNTLLTTSFDASRDKVLLIGRASKIGDRGYNIALSGKRAGEIRDYLTTIFNVPEEQIRYQFFGFDPPQLTLDYAAQYGISAADLMAVDANAKKVQAKVNQSVVVIIYKGGDINEVLNAAEDAGTNKLENSSKN